jgi:hypothetical protein
MLALGRHRGPRAAAEPEAVRPVERTLLRMTLAGANPAPSAAGIEELPGKVNYFIGKDPKAWRTNIPTYGKVRYGAVYRGIDLVYYGNGRQLEYDFIVAPGADPRVITLAFEGAGALTVSTEGDLVLQTRGGELRLRKPLIYQEVGGAKRSVPGGYVVKGERGVGFQVAAYDGTKPLIIDPVLVYSTYLGGSGEDNGSAIAADATGIYLAGLTISPDFPPAGSPSPYQGGQVGDYDAFVTKLNPAGTALIYSTYLGGTGTDYGLALAVDASGNAYVTGSRRRPTSRRRAQPFRAPMAAAPPTPS